jgi:hypothetical protein
MNRSRLTALAPFALIAAFAIAIYAYVLPLPFFRDDMVMLLWLREMPWGKLWVDATGFPYYRPLSFSTLKLSELVFGWPEPISLHVLNLALHAANSVMVALLVLQTFEVSKASKVSNRIAAISAGLLFAAFPFTYEIVPTTGPIFQLQAAFFGLGSALTYAEFRSTLYAPHSTRKWLWFSLALALLGTFTCEYGVIIPAFIVLVELMCWMKSAAENAESTEVFQKNAGRPLRSLQPKELSPLPLAYFGFAALYLVAWVLVPKSRAELPLILQGLTPALRDMPITALYYLQGLTYPLQTLAWPLVRATGMSAELAVSLIAALTLAGIVAVFARARRLPLLAFALAWFAIALAPMWPSLNADYTLNGPRLHYLPAIGTTMMWGSLIAILFSHRKGTQKTRDLCVLAVQTLGVLVLIATLVQSLAFLYGMADVITIGARLTADVSRAIATPPDEPTLVVNFPSWTGKRETTFALGAEGISFLPGYSTMREMVLLNTRQNRNVDAVTFTNTIKEWKYDQRLGPPLNWNKLLKAVRAARRVWMVEYLPDTLRLSEAGSMEQSAQLAAPEVIFGERIGVRLMRYNMAADELHLELAWTTLAAVDQQLTAFVHIYDSQGKLVAQQDGYPLLGLAPPWLTQIGEVTRDVRRVPLPTQLAAGHYVVGVGVYDAETGQRTLALSPTGKRFENDVYLFYGFDVKISNIKSLVSNFN